MADFDERFAPLADITNMPDSERLRSALLARLNAENYNAGTTGKSLLQMGKDIWNYDLAQHIPQSPNRLSILNAVRGMLRGSTEAATNLPQNVAQGVEQTLTLPQRSFEASEAMRGGYGYDPGPGVEAALTTMGGTSFGAPAGAAGAGPTFRKSLLDLGTEARLARAEAQGFDTSAPLYHGTSKDFDFKTFKDTRHGTWTTIDPVEASGYAIQNDSKSFRLTGKGWEMEPVNSASRVLPLYAKPLENPYTGAIPDAVRNASNYKKAQSAFFDQLRGQGYDGVLLPGGIRVDFNNANLRSTLAPFDPKNEGRSVIFGAGAADRRGAVALAAPEEINRVAAETSKGITQPALRKTYEELGLTGGAPSELVQPSLAAKQPQQVIDQAIALKQADREAMRGMTEAESKVFAKTGELPGGRLLPSQEAMQPALEAYAPIKKEVTRAEKAFDKAAASGARSNTVLFDLSPQTLNRVPDVPQFNLPRVAPDVTERLASVPRGGLRRLETAAAQAPEQNWGWYNLMQARDIFHQLHGAQKGEQAFQGWLDAVAGTSMVNPIDNNLRSSTWYLQQLLQGKPMPHVTSIVDPATGKTVRLMAGGPPPGYGAKSQIQHADRVLEYLTHSYDPVANPKPISYRTNLSGNWMPRTVDTHDIRNAVGMPQALELFGENAGLLPKEYSYLEQLGQRAANRAGSTQAAQQAATWIGGGKYTGLKSFPAPLLEVLNRRAHVTGAVRGQSPLEALLDAFRGKQPLL